MITYKKENVNIETRYTIEFIDNENDFDYVNSGKINKGEPCDRYKTKQFDNMDDALSLYMVYLVKDIILDIKFFEEILIDGETIRESYIEPVSTTAYSLKNVINKSQYEINTRQEKKIDSLEFMNKLYKNFIDKNGANKMFETFCKENEGKNVYRYYSIERPVMPGSYPKNDNVLEAMNYDNRTLVNDIGRLAWGYVEYSKPLTKNDCYEYELEPSIEVWRINNGQAYQKDVGK